MNDYELMIETASNISYSNFPHTRKGYEAALHRIEKNKSNLIAATIVSNRDGKVYDFSENKS